MLQILRAGRYLVGRVHAIDIPADTPALILAAGGGLEAAVAVQQVEQGLHQYW